jgi:hypothetical protein
MESDPNCEAPEAWGHRTGVLVMGKSSTAHTWVGKLDAQEEYLEVTFHEDIFSEDVWPIALYVK